MAALPVEAAPAEDRVGVGGEVGRETEVAGLIAEAELPGCLDEEGEQVLVFVEAERETASLDDPGAEPFRIRDVMQDQLSLQHRAKD